MYYILFAIFIVSFFLTFTNIKTYKYILISTLLLSLLAYFYDPVYAFNKYGYYTDACRFIDDMSEARSLGDEYEGYLSAPLSRLYVLFFAYLDNDSLLPAISCMIFYFLGASTLYKIGKRNENSRNEIVKSIFLFMVSMNYSIVICNIRYPIAMTIFFLILYRDLIENKKSRLLYFIPFFLHPGSICFILLRFLVEIKFKYSVIFFCVITVVFMFMNETIFLFLALKIASLGINPYLIYDMQYKFNGYTDMSNFVDSTLAYNIFFSIIVVSTSAFLFLAKNIKKHNFEVNWDKFIFVGIWGTLISLATSGNYQIMYRFAILSMMFFPAAWLLCIKNNNIYNYKNKNNICNFAFFSICILSMFFYFGQEFGYNVLMFYGE